MNKKVITIFLLLLFTVNEFSFITVYLPLRNLATYVQKARVDNSVEPNDFALIVIKESEINNESAPVKFLENSELLYNDEMYDVINTVNKDGDVYIYCVKDETENMLDKSFNLHFDNSQNRSFSLSFFNLTVAKKLLPFIFSDDINYSVLQIERVRIQNINLKSVPFIEKDIPPPKFS